MNFKEKLSKIIEKLDNIFMKNHKCLSCGREIPDGSKFQLCESCLSGFELISGPVCAKCGDAVLDGNKFCGNCQSFNYHFDTSNSLCYYNDISSKIVLELKYNHRKYYAKEIAKMMQTNSDIFKNIDLITCVPSSKRTLRSRGYNQAKIIAEQLAKAFNLPVIETLTKLDTKLHQTGSSQRERLKNLKGTFKICDGVDINNKNILLVDDVFTTGSTLDECAKTLKKAKPKAVRCYTFAKTKFNFTKK